MTQIQEVELSIEQAKQVIATGEKALKLADNKLFKELVLQGYLIDEAARLAHLSADLSLTVEQRDDVIKMIQAVGFFKKYMQVKVQQGEIASRELESHLQTLEEIQQEDAE